MKTLISTGIRRRIKMSIIRGTFPGQRKCHQNYKMQKKCLCNFFNKSLFHSSFNFRREKIYCSNEKLHHISSNNRTMAPKRKPLKDPPKPSPTKSSKGNDESTPAPTVPPSTDDESSELSDRSTPSPVPVSPLQEESSTSTPKKNSSTSAKGTPKGRKKPNPEIYNRKNTDLSRVSIGAIKKQAVKPLQKFEPLGGGKGRKSQYPEPLRAEQKRLQQEHASKPVAEGGKREYSKRWDPNSDPTRKLPKRAVQKMLNEDSDSESIAAPFTEKDKFKETSKMAAQNQFLHRKKRSPNKAKPRQRAVSEANLMDDSRGNDSDGGQAGFAYRSRSNTPQRDSNQSKKGQRSQSTGNLVDDTDEYGVNDQIREQHRKKKEKARLEKEKNDKKEQERTERLKKQYESLVQNPRRRSKSVDFLNQYDDDIKPLIPLPPSSNVTVVPPLKPGVTPPSPNRKSPPANLRSSPAKSLDSNQKRGSATPSKNPPPKPNPKPKPKATNGNEGQTKAISSPTKSPQKRRSIGQDVPTENKDVAGNVFPRIDALWYFRQKLKQWDSKICDSLQPLLNNLNVNEKFRLTSMKLAEEHASYINKTNAKQNRSPEDEEKIRKANDDTEDMMIGLFICILEQIFGKVKGNENKEGTVRKKGLTEERVKQILDPNFIILQFIPCLVEAFKVLTGVPPFLKERFIPLTPTYGVQLQGTAKTTLLNSIQHLKDIILWAKIGRYDMNVGDGKSLYPKQLLNDKVMGALVLLRCRRSQTDPKQVKSTFVCPLELHFLNNQRIRHMEYDNHFSGIVDTILESPHWDLCFAPLFVGGNHHWMMALATRENRSIVLYDPFQVPFKIGLYFSESKSRSAKPVDNELTNKLTTFKLLMEGVTQDEWCTGIDFREEYFEKVTALTKQTDGHSCGPISVLYAEFKMRIPELFSKANVFGESRPDLLALSVRYFRDIQINDEKPLRIVRGAEVQPTTGTSIPPLQHDDFADKPKTSKPSIAPKPSMGIKLSQPMSQQDTSEIPPDDAEQTSSKDDGSPTANK